MKAAKNTRHRRELDDTGQKKITKARGQNSLLMLQPKTLYSKEISQNKAGHIIGWLLDKNSNSR